MLAVLNAVHDNSAVTQRTLARELGVALGIANAYLRRCVEKGLIKVRQAPARRYAYYLTPRGFSEKSRLTAEYLTVSFQFFRTARSQSEALLADCAGRGWRRLALAGAGELAEIMRLCAADAGVDLVAVVDPDRAGQRCAGMPVVATLAGAGPVDAVIVTDLRSPQATFEGMRLALAAAGPERVLAPGLLKVSLVTPAVLPEDEAS